MILRTLASLHAALILLVAAADTSAAAGSMSAEQNGHCRTEVLMVSLQFGHGST
ncbi:hypothetical protein [Granulicella mallensis]|uniref:Uncharacterized protein n=1 Tax=Granulicella mallensis TaxID=940614 RepID=A0A7W7ZNB9_9BACT|nr:hypothetical protein [Granulicella mallensis]MBB5063120.1 hypothetical protein [Granulicella mallensis]